MTVMNVVVGGSLIAIGVAVVGWLLRPDLRERLERPKHQFHERLRRYDRSLHD